MEFFLTHRYVTNCHLYSCKICALRAFSFALETHQVFFQTETVIFLRRTLAPVTNSFFKSIISKLWKLSKLIRTLVSPPLNVSSVAQLGHFWHIYRMRRSKLLLLSTKPYVTIVQLKDENIIISVQKQLGNIALPQVYEHEGTQIFTGNHNTRPWFKFVTNVPKRNVLLSSLQEERWRINC